MAIYNQQIAQSETGFAKGIDAGSMRMVLDNLQRTQYQHPEKSTIRELTSNGIDAIRERNLALKILSGEEQVERHFIKLEGEEYKDSYFNPSYYDPAWLSNDPNVYIIYQEGSPLEKDKLIIKDNGVGLGGSRLEGYFQLGYSTKRLSRVGLGKFGIGAKAALSTGVPYYVVKNRYHGKETWFNIYPYQAEPSVPALNTQLSQENPFFEMNGIRCHYLSTTEKNGLEVILEVKKHHKQRYIDAVKSQLLYFDNVVFRIIAFNGTIENVEVKSKILYEDDIMILSDNRMYTKPHILINRVNYGNIDFQELELEDKIGNISIKMKPEEVSVSPSREHVLWDDMTRASIVKRFKEVQEAAEKMLQGELQHTDFMKWLKSCILIKNKISTEQADGLVARLAKLVDLQNYTPRYKPDPSFQLNKDLFAGIRVRKITGKTERHGSTYKLAVDRKQAGLADLVGDIPVFIQLEDTNWLRDRYLLEDVYQDGFVTIYLNKTDIPKPTVEELGEEADLDTVWESRKRALILVAKDAAAQMRLYDPVISPFNTEETINRESMGAAQVVIERWRKLNQYILSSEGIQFYDNIEIPEGYRDHNKGVTEDEAIKQEAEVQTKEARISAEARRKLTGKTILFTPRVRSYIGHEADWLYTWEKVEIPVKEIDEWNNPEVYYSSDDDSSLLQLAAFLTRPENEQLVAPRDWEEEEEETVYSSYQAAHAPNYTIETKTINKSSHLTAFAGPDVEVKLIKVAKDRVKYYQDFKHIRQFFAQITKNKVITMSNSLIRWNTARYIAQYLPQLRFLENFKPFHEEYSQMYHTLRNYVNKYYREVANYTGKFKEIQAAEYQDMTRHLDKVTELQIFVRDHSDDKEAIAAMVIGLFGKNVEESVNDGCGIDMNLYDQVQKLMEYAEPIGLLLNYMPVLTGERMVLEDDDSNSHQKLTEELEMEIRSYIQFKQTGM